MKHLMIALLLLSCAGCELLQPNQNDRQLESVVPTGQRHYWLSIADLYMDLTPTQAQQRLDQTGAQKSSNLQLFRYALLNQQLNERTGWVRSRDAYRQLLDTPNLTAELRGISKVLLKYNQSMINWYVRYNKVQIELKESEAMQQVLEEKIQAITNLEQSMSSRKEKISE